MCKENCVNRSRQTVNVSRRKCVKWRKNRHISLHLHSSTSSLWSPQGSGGIPLARKMCYAVGGVPYQMTTVAMGLSLQIFLLDVVQVKVALTNNRFFYHPMYLSGFQSKAHQYFTDGGLLRLHDFICESGLGCRVRPPCWISGGPQ